MDYPFEHDDFAGRRLNVRLGGLFGSAILLENGVQLSGSRGSFSLRDNSGQVREISLKTKGVDALPVLALDGEKFPLARPLAWFEYLWMGLPIALVFTGGGLGALFGLAATYFSGRIFRSDRSTLSKYGLSGLASLGALAFFLVGVLGIQYAVSSLRDPASRAALEDVATAMNNELPILFDDGTEFYQVEGREGVLVFRYRLPSVAFEEVDAEAFMKRMQAQVLSQMCAKADLRSDFLDEGVLVRLSYAASDKTEFAQIEVSSEACESIQD